MYRLFSLSAATLFMFLTACGPQVSPREAALQASFFDMPLSENDKGLLKTAFSNGWPAITPNLDAFVINFVQSDAAFFTELIEEYPLAIPNLPTILIESVYKFSNEGNYDVATLCLEIAEKQFTHNPDVLAAGGALRMSTGDTELAISLLETALSWEPDNHVANYHLGYHLLKSEKAIDQLRGKNLLQKSLDLSSPSTSARAATILLSQDKAKLLNSELSEVFNKLRELEFLKKQSLEKQDLSLLLLLAQKTAEINDPSLVPILKEISIRDELPAGSILLCLYLALSTDVFEDFAPLLEHKAIKELDEENALFSRKQVMQIAYDLRLQKEQKAIELFQTLALQEKYKSDLSRSFSILMNPDLSVSTQLSLLKGFINLPIVSYHERLVVYMGLSNLQPLQEEKWVNAALESLFHEVPVETASWIFSDTKQTYALIQFIEAERSSQKTSTLENRLLLEAYYIIESVEEAENLFSAIERDLNPVYAAYSKAQIAFMSEGTSNNAITAWEKANLLAREESNYPLLKRLGSLSKEMNQPQKALTSLYDAFTAGVSFSIREAEELLGLSMTHGNLTQSVQISKFLKSKLPENPVYINNLSYYNFLANRNTEEFIEKMRELVEEYSDVTEYKLTLALGLMKIGRSNEAKRIVDDARIDLTKIGPRGQMIYAAVIAASGQQTVARGLVQNLDIEGLIPEEIALIESL